MMRHHAAYCSPLTGQLVGLFVAVWYLVDKKILTDDEVSEYWETRRFLERVLLVPSFYAHGDLQGTVTWFRDTAAVRRWLIGFGFYSLVLAAYGFKLCEARTQDPGEIIHEDE